MGLIKGPHPKGFPTIFPMKYASHECSTGSNGRFSDTETEKIHLGVNPKIEVFKKMDGENK